MFRLLRYFSITSLIAFVVVVALLGLFYRQSALSDLMMLQEQQHVAFTQSFANSVWPDFESFAISDAARSADELRADPMTDRLRQAVLAQLAGTSVVKGQDLQPAWADSFFDSTRSDRRRSGCECRYPEGAIGRCGQRADAPR